MQETPGSTGPPTVDVPEASVAWSDEDCGQRFPEETRSCFEHERSDKTAPATRLEGEVASLVSVEGNRTGDKQALGCGPTFARRGI